MGSVNGLPKLLPGLLAAPQHSNWQTCQGFVDLCDCKWAGWAESRAGSTVSGMAWLTPPGGQGKPFFKDG